MNQDAQVKTPNDRQVELEQWSYRIGGQRATSGKWEAGAQGFLTQQFATLYLRAALKMAKDARSKAVKYGAIWQLMENDKAVAQVALESLSYILSNADDGMTRNRLASQLGTRAEWVIFLLSKRFKGSRHIDNLRLINGRNLGMSLMRKRLMDGGFHQARDYKPLSNLDKVVLGTLFLEIANRCTGLIRFEVERANRNMTVTRCYFTEAYWKFLDRWKDNLEQFRPAYMPMIVPPKPWTGLSDGGYLTTATNVSKVPWERWPALTKHAHPCLLGSINILQQQAFRLNQEQLELQNWCWDQGIAVGGLPPRDRVEMPDRGQYRKEGRAKEYWPAFYAYKADQRLNSIRTKFIHCRLAWKRLEDFVQLYFVHQMDYRGRLYARGSQINYLGSDPFRTQLVFDQDAPISGNEDELYWAIGEAAGLKPDQETRTTWCLQHAKQIIKAGDNPLDYRAFWEDRKSPWRFIQLCLEMSCFDDDPDYRTRTVFQLDQCTSAYGHVACLLRSDWMAKLTNVIGGWHHDLYEIVGSAAYNLMGGVTVEPKLKHEDYAIGWWKEHGIPRSLTKRCVMPVVYRRSYQSMVEAIQLVLRDEIGDFLTADGVRLLDLAHTLAKYMHLAVKDCLPGVHNLHHWLVKVAKLQMEMGLRPYWVTPNGLAVESYSSLKEVKTHELVVSGKRINVTIRDNEGQPPSPTRSTGQLSADFVHSQDAAFLQRFIWHWGNTYGHPIVTVHDCVGTTIDKVGLLRKELPDQFARFYSSCHLTRMHQQLEKELKIKIPAPPIEGSLDVEKIGENPFLFT